ncbi:hypothetical protein KVR01_006188 [Diaporthe batatas]|uniref:uncharacterized protein n=1 Tax=Diaporthe batatas TaxID=748121 RepID=UPI001D050886|nr:uncharacterized protein KVR01_006188 [Diaporthe batatas]KAG8164270.1 hypothetical protein KVR01_006188 [Diaporthe batatas]
MPDDMRAGEAEDDGEAEWGLNGDDGAPERSPAQRWAGTISGITMVVTAAVTILFGPELNAQEHFLSLDPQVLNTVHWVLNGAWALSFGLYAFHGQWGVLEPLPRSCHWLGSISVVAIALALDLNITQRMPVSSYALAVTIVVEWVYRWVTVVCHVVEVAVGAVVVVLQTTGDIAAAAGGVAAAVGDLMTTVGNMVGAVGPRLGVLVNVHL